MYKRFFGLLKSPFNMTPDPRFLYLAHQHREALAGLTYAVLARKGFVVLTGDAGTGKTTLLTRVLQHLPPTTVQTSVISNPTLTPAEFLEATLLDFGFTDIPASKAQRIFQLQSFLLTGHRQGKVSALIVDEAHKLTPEVLEEIRLLGNFESADEKLLQVALVGQNELDTLLDREQLRQFKQRIAVRLSMSPLSGGDIEQYMRFRWMKAGGNELPFSKEAIRIVAQVSQGVPRVINVICDNTLMHAFAEETAAVQQRHVVSACKDLRLAVPSVSPVPAAPAVAATEPAAVATSPDYPIKTLERYDTGSGTKASLLTRLAGKLGFAQGVETA
jgi:general secretion pathway protein A